MGATILVADDDRAIRTVLNQALARLGHDVRMTGNAATLWRWVAEGEGDLRSELLKDVLKTFRAADIEIPYPRRDLRILATSETNQSPKLSIT